MIFSHFPISYTVLNPENSHVHELPVGSFVPTFCDPRSIVVSLIFIFIFRLQNGIRAFRFAQPFRLLEIKYQ